MATPPRDTDDAATEPTTTDAIRSGDPNDAPIVVTSEQLNAQRNGAGNTETPQRPRFRRSFSRDRVRVAYNPDGTFVVVVGDAHNERVLTGAYRYALMHGGDGAMPTLAVWLNEPDPSGAMPLTAPLDVPEVELLDVEKLKLTLHAQATGLAFTRSLARRACGEAIVATLRARGHDVGAPGQKMPAGIDPFAIVDNAMLVAYAEYYIAKPTLGDALVNARLAADDLATLTQAGVVSGDESLAAVRDASVAIEQLIEATTWQAIEKAHAETRAEPDIKPDIEAVEQRARELANSMLAEERRAHELALAQMAERLNAGTGSDIGAADRRSAVEDFVDWLVGPDGPQVMRATTASQRESRTRDLVESWVECRTRGEQDDTGSNASNSADERGAR